MAFALLVALVGCTPRGAKTSDTDRVHIATTIAPVADLVQRIAGDEIEVQILLPEGATPEVYEPTPQDMATLATCQAYLYVGDLGFETSWVKRIAELYPDVRRYRLDAGGEALDTCDGDDHDHSHDPHYWMSFLGMRIMAGNVLGALIELCPDRAEAYRSAYEAFIAELDQHEHRGAEVASADSITTPVAQSAERAFIIYHPSLTYYAIERGIAQLVIEHDGKDPSPRQLESIIARARELEARYVFVQQEFSPRLTESIARELGAETIVINPLDRDWLSQLLLIDSLLHRPR